VNLVVKNVNGIGHGDIIRLVMVTARSGAQRSVSMASKKVHKLIWVGLERILISTTLCGTSNPYDISEEWFNVTCKKCAKMDLKMLDAGVDGDE